MSNGDENMLIKGIKCLNEITKTNENNEVLIKEGCLFKLMEVVNNSKLNLVALSLDIIAKLIQSNEGQEVFIQNNGIPLIFPLIVDFLIINRITMREE